MEINFINNQNIIEYDKELEELLIKVIKECIKEEGIKSGCEVSISFVDNSDIRDLNRDYRNIDKPTDVLSFPQYEDPHGIDYEPLLLGDIVISMEQAKAQSLEYGHSFEREMAFLTAHSMFHLFGYDHDTDENTKIMRSKEERVLELLGILRL